jgi:transcriptional regulator with XRE-family HTH domain
MDQEIDAQATYTLSAAALLKGVSAETGRQTIIGGTLRGWKVDGEWRIAGVDLAAWDASGRARPRDLDRPRVEVDASVTQLSVPGGTDTRRGTRGSRSGREAMRRLDQTIRDRRMELKMSQSHRGALMGGLDQKEVSRLEHGYVASPPPDRLRRAAIALDLAPEDLFARAGWSEFDRALTIVRLPEARDAPTPELVSPDEQRIAVVLRHLSSADRALMLALAERLAALTRDDESEPNAVTDHDPDE